MCSSDLKCSADQVDHNATDAGVSVKRDVDDNAVIVPRYVDEEELQDAGYQEQQDASDTFKKNYNTHFYIPMAFEHTRNKDTQLNSGKQRKLRLQQAPTTPVPPSSGGGGVASPQSTEVETKTPSPTAASTGTTIAQRDELERVYFSALDRREELENLQIGRAHV